MSKISLSLYKQRGIGWQKQIPPGVYFRLFSAFLVISERFFCRVLTLANALKPDQAHQQIDRRR
ncbi:hypothetical protein [Undibacterium sp. 14-3-2]|uniref:hypothetical protein n=1 Tax=Undibacterium sp. 14-3-2 TaxID=2800129 RepID=UPI001F367830|nr:hypothetical protein [Undibacterium sp. 14-3-2]